jgi:spore photoproduct lyase
VGLDHGGRTRVRASVNVPEVERFEGGTARVDARLHALGRMAAAGYRVGLTVAPIMPVEDWDLAYGALLDQAADVLRDAGADTEDVTVEAITHRFTATSRDVLHGWYPKTALEMDEDLHSQKRTKFGGAKFVYPKPVLDAIREFFATEVPRRIPGAQLLYVT